MTRWLRWLIMAALTAGAAWPSYLHGLFIVREVGYTGSVAFDVPLLPDGLIGVSTVALIEAAQRKVKRPVWATAGLVLGIVLTCAQNIASGYPRGGGAMLVNGLVPVLLIIALEILVWSSRLPRRDAAPAAAPVLVPAGQVAADSYQAAEHAFAASVAGGNPISQNKLIEKFGLTRTQAQKVRASLNGATADAT